MYIAIEGPIGVGKTSLSRILSEHYRARLLEEVVEENPFLPSFYQDPERYGFQVQVFFLLSRFRQLEGAAQGELFSRSLVADYLFDKDFIFASMNLKDSEFSLYADLYTHLKPRLPQPDLTVYLRADVDLLLERIEKRGRPYEKTIKAQYLQELLERYDEYFSSFAGKLLILNAHEFDFVEGLQDRISVLERVEQVLGVNV